MNRILLTAIRHRACGLAARLLLLSGRARRAKRRLLEQGDITGIYFHNPRPDLFLDCVVWLKEQGCTFLSGRQVLEILRDGAAVPAGAVWLSFDDAYEEWARTVVPVAREHKALVTLFVPSGVVAGDGLFPWIHDAGYRSEDPVEKPVNGKPAGVREALTPEQIGEMARYPEVEIGGHTVNHKVMTLCTDDELVAEVAGCKRTLEAWTGTEVNLFAYPAGRHDDRSQRVLRAHGFELAATTEPRLIGRNADPLLIPRICVPDEVTLPEAICRMLGIWDPFMDRVRGALHRWRGGPANLRRRPA